MVMSSICLLHLSFLLIKMSYILTILETNHGSPPQSWEKHCEGGLLLREVKQDINFICESSMGENFVFSLLGVHSLVWWQPCGLRVQLKTNHHFLFSLRTFWLPVTTCQAHSFSSPSLHSWTLWSLWLFTFPRYFHESYLPNSSSNSHSQRPCWHLTCHIWWNLYLTLDSQRPGVVSNLGQLYQLRRRMGGV